MEYVVGGCTAELTWHPSDVGVLLKQWAVGMSRWILCMVKKAEMNGERTDRERARLFFSSSGRISFCT